MADSDSEESYMSLDTEVIQEEFAVHHKMQLPFLRRLFDDKESVMSLDSEQKQEEFAKYVKTELGDVKKWFETIWKPLVPKTRKTKRKKNKIPDDTEQPTAASNTSSSADAAVEAAVADIRDNIDRYKYADVPVQKEDALTPRDLVVPNGVLLVDFIQANDNIQKTVDTSDHPRASLVESIPTSPVVAASPAEPPVQKQAPPTKPFTTLNTLPLPAVTPPIILDVNVEGAVVQHNTPSASASSDRVYTPIVAIQQAADAAASGKREVSSLLDATPKPHPKRNRTSVDTSDTCKPLGVPDVVTSADSVSDAAAVSVADAALSDVATDAATSQTPLYNSSVRGILPTRRANRHTAKRAQHSITPPSAKRDHSGWASLSWFKTITGKIVEIY